MSLDFKILREFRDWESSEWDVQIGPSFETLRLLYKGEAGPIEVRFDRVTRLTFLPRPTTDQMLHRLDGVPKGALVELQQYRDDQGLFRQRVGVYGSGKTFALSYVDGIVIADAAGVEVR